MLAYQKTQGWHWKCVGYWIILPLIILGTSLWCVKIWNAKKIPTPPMAMLQVKEDYIAKHDSLVHRLIAMEYQYKTTTKLERARAFYMMDLALNDFSDVPVENSHNGMLIFLPKIAQWIDSHFVYWEKTGFTKGVNLGGIDCDLRSLLYVAIAASRGVNINMILAPYHAFVEWQKKGEETIRWETTVTGGKVADLNHSFYKKSNNPNDYVPLTEEAIEAVLKHIVSSEMSEDDQLDEVISLREAAYQLSGNEFYRMNIASWSDDIEIWKEYQRKLPMYEAEIEESLGKHAWDTGDMESAVAHYQKAIVLGRYDPDTYYRIAEHSRCLKAMAYYVNSYVLRGGNYLEDKKITIVDSWYYVVLILFYLFGLYWVLYEVYTRKLRERCTTDL